MATLIYSIGKIVFYKIEENLNFALVFAKKIAVALSPLST
jgi:hypothetical protein